MTPSLARRHFVSLSPSLSSVRRPGVPDRAGPFSYSASLATRPPLQPSKIDKDFERQAARKKLECRPEEVTTTSSVRQLVEPSQAAPSDDVDILVGVKNDMQSIKETFALSAVPRRAYVLGLAGTLPFLATSMATVFLSWNLNTELPTRSFLLNRILFDHDAATYWLSILEPIQVGYGAVIISFLGAVHWGLELGEKQPAHDRTRLRYTVGFLSPVIAWPTMFMPVEWALITQFLAFCGLYSFDYRSTVRGWTPPWYSTYRFVLTGVVGSAIVISLIVRAKIGEAGKEHTPAVALQDRVQGIGRPCDDGQRRDWAKEEEHERTRIREERKKEKKRREDELSRQEKIGKKDGSRDDGKQDKTSESPGRKMVQNEQEETKDRSLAGDK
ncbi:hypothetical protein VTJ83DRAFT_55 [Remersonia thermophila]|uniref:Mitochondrial inner membrane protein 1 n=1 Tax=Remersonia thermophila TaxID=72144 RepID=A0ABR4DK00_9PEZI